MAGKRLIVTKAAKAAFAARLRSIMEERGLSVGETARRLVEQLREGEALSRATVLHYLSGRSMPRLRYLDALSAALDVPTCDLVPHLGWPTHDPRNTHPAFRGDRASGDGGAYRHSGLTIDDLGSEVHLRIEQRVPWPVALEILSLLKVEP
jgi:transcriptional regulator with XRE-family HTH domain